MKIPKPSQTAVFLVAIILAVGIVAVVAVFVYDGKISLEDLCENPHAYLDVMKNGLIDLSASREIYSKLTVVGVESLLTPDGQLGEARYRVIVRDGFGYERSFVILEDALPRYEERVEETVVFRVVVNLGSELVQSPYVPITNLLAAKEGIYGFYYNVWIFPADQTFVNAG